MHYYTMTLPEIIIEVDGMAPWMTILRIPNRWFSTSILIVSGSVCVYIFRYIYIYILAFGFPKPPKLIWRAGGTEVKKSTNSWVAQKLQHFPKLLNVDLQHLCKDSGLRVDGTSGPKFGAWNWTHLSKTFWGCQSTPINHCKPLVVV